MQAEIFKVCKSAFGDEETITGLSRLSGGANMETWAFDLPNPVSPFSSESAKVRMFQSY